MRQRFMVLMGAGALVVAGVTGSGAVSAARATTSTRAATDVPSDCYEKEATLLDRDKPPQWDRSQRRLRYVFKIRDNSEPCAIRVSWIQIDDDDKGYWVSVLHPVGEYVADNRVLNGARTIKNLEAVVVPEKHGYDPEYGPQPARDCYTRGSFFCRNAGLLRQDSMLIT